MSRHLLLGAGVLLAAGWGAGAEADGLNVSVNKLARGGYAFTLEQKPGPGTGGAVEVKYQKGKPLYCKADMIEFFKKGDAVVYKQGDSWVRSKRGTVSDPLRVLGALAKVNSVRLPHEELAGLARLIKGRRASKEEGQTVYSADLTDEGVKRFVRPEHRGVAKGGTARFWVGRGGTLTRYEVTIRVRGRMGDAEVDGTVTKTVAIKGAGSTKVEVPAGAKKALE
jgi:hypothetical protein